MALQQTRQKRSYGM